MAEASGNTKPVIDPTLRRSSVVHAWLTSPVFLELQGHAQRRRVHPDVLTAQLLERVITGGLVDHILDR